jgi:hypothetical protein
MGESTTAIDSSGNNNEGTLEPSGSGPSWTTGQVGGALNFDGVDDYVIIPASSTLDLGSPLAIELWFNAFDYPTAGDYDCLIFIETNSGGYHRGIWGHSSGKLYFQPGGSYATWLSDIEYSLNQWTHIATNIYQQGSSIIQEIYINGALATTHTYPSSTMWSNAGPYRIGADNMGRYFDGMIDEVAIWNRVLSLDEIQQHYNNGDGVEITPDSSTMGLWHFEEEPTLNEGIENSLLSKLDAALDCLENGNDNAAINILNAFINSVSAQSGKKLTVAQADELITAAQNILDAI